MNSLVIIQARMSSSRLPGKVLKEVCQKPLLFWMIEQVNRCSLVDDIIIATSNNVEDDQIEYWCIKNNIKCYRGHLDDVLARFYFASKEHKAQTIVRLTADCPLIDPSVIDEHISFYHSHQFDYVSNGPIMTYPDGMGVEVFSKKILEISYKNAKLKSEREHVTAHIYNNPSQFKLFNTKFSQDLSNVRITVDYPEDFVVIDKVINGLSNNNAEFNLENIIEFLNDNPEILSLNNKYKPNEGYDISLSND